MKIFSSRAGKSNLLHHPSSSRRRVVRTAFNVRPAFSSNAVDVTGRNRPAPIFLPVGREEPSLDVSRLGLALPGKRPEGHCARKSTAQYQERKTKNEKDKQAEGDADSQQHYSSGRPTGRDETPPVGNSCHPR